MSDDHLNIDWEVLAGGLADKVRPETRSKYFPKNPLRQLIIRRFLDRVGKALEEFEWETLMDLGCGEGFVDYYLAARFSGAKITGVEPDREALEVARTLNPGFEYLSADGRELPFDDQSFDALISCEVLEHVVDYPLILKEARRVCRGPCIFTVPAFPFYQMTNFLIGKNLSRLGEHPDHVVQFTSGKLRTGLLSAFGSARVTLSYPWLIGVAGK